MVKIKTRPGKPMGSKVAPLAADQAAARLREAAVHRVAERYDEALAIYESLERSNPLEGDPPYFIALIDLVQGRPARALVRLEWLVKRLPNSTLVWLTYAHALRELGQWRDSIKASRRALELCPDDTNEQFALAKALEVVGEMDDALALLRALAADPATRLGALMIIAQISPSAISDTEFAELAAVASDPQNTAEFQIAMNFAVGPLLERRGDYDGAFAAFAEGARLKRLTLTGEIEIAPRPAFSEPARMLPPAEAEKIALEETGLMTSLFTPEFLADEQGHGSHMATPIFIVGMPRSGSTLIEQILSSHAKVQGLGETGALYQTLVGKYPIKFLESHGPNHYRDLAGAYLAAMHDRGWTTSARFIDKMLNNYVFVGMIHLMFPKATILHTVRDPVDTCLSNFRTPFHTAQEESYDLADIGRAYVRYRKMMEHWDQVLPGRVIDVDHETLVADPETRIRWLVTEACGLNWDPACLEFHKTKRSVRTASIVQVRQPIFKTSVQRWRKYEKHLGPLFDALGPYAPARS